MRAGEPSDTAEAMAAARAVGSYAYRAEGIVDDPFAEHFLGRRMSLLYRGLRRAGSARLALAFAALYDRMLPGAVGYILTRHRYFDDAIDKAIAEGATQVVFVGAGYDSRAFRQKSLAKTRIFEVDHPDTQARKKEIVAKIFGELPQNVHYLPLNATQGDLRKLAEHGFDRAAKAVFVVEGFLWYMPPAVARDILSAIAEIAAAGSRVIFDHILPSVVDGTCRLEGAARHRAYCERRGEPILFGIEPENLASYLREVGLHLVEDVDHEILKARYTRGSRREIKVYPFLRIAVAEVGPTLS